MKEDKLKCGMEVWCGGLQGLIVGLLPDSAYLHIAGFEGVFHAALTDITPISVRCECGADKLNLGGHSHWCPKGVR